MAASTTVNKEVIHKTSIEKSFITDIYNSIKNIHSSITCAETIDGQFDDPEVDIPTFNFTISPSVVLQMKRYAGKSTATNIYIFSVLINGDVTATANVTISESAAAIDASVERKGFIGWAVHANSDSVSSNLLDLFIWIGGRTVETFASADISTCVINAEFDSVPTRFAAGIAGPSLESAIYYRAPLPEGGVSIEYTFANLFGYSAEPGFIEYITHVSFINAGQEQFRSEYITNCSTIAQGRSAAIADGIYFSVGPHSLIKLG